MPTGGQVAEACKKGMHSPTLRGNPECPDYPARAGHQAVLYPCKHGRGRSIASWHIGPWTSKPSISMIPYPHWTRPNRSAEHHRGRDQPGAGRWPTPDRSQTTATAATGPPNTWCTTIQTADGATGDRTMSDVVGGMEEKRAINEVGHRSEYATADSFADALIVRSRAKHCAANVAPRRPNEVQP